MSYIEDDDGQDFYEQVARQEEWEEALEADMALEAEWTAQEVLAREEGAVYAAIATLNQAMQGDEVLTVSLINELLLKYNKIVVDL
jgi:hypothetical protein